MQSIPSSMGRNLFHYFLRPGLSGEGGRPFNIFIIIVVVVTFPLLLSSLSSRALRQGWGAEPCRGSELYGTIGTGVAYLSPRIYPNTPPHVNPILVARYQLAHLHPSNTHRYIFVLLNVFPLLATQSPVGGEVGVAGEGRGLDMQLQSVRALYLSRLRSPLLSGAVLPDPDLELAEAAEKTSISKRRQHKLLEIMQDQHRQD